MRRRIAVTTTSDRFDRWAGPLADQGFDPVCVPCIEVRPHSELGGARELQDTDWLVVTSPRVVEILWPGGGMPSVPVAAVGETTADAISAAGGNVAITGDNDGERLVEVLSGRLRGRRVVFPHGSRTNPARVQQLREAGAEVTELVVYDTVPVPAGSEPVDGAVFGSPTAVEGWSSSRSLAPLAPVGAIGRVTAEALHREGVSSLVVSPTPTPEQLAVAMSAILESKP